MTSRATRMPAGTVALPMALALIAGLVDVTTFVLLGGIFSAHITGNLVVVAAALALHRPLDAAALISIPLFILVTGALTALVDRSTAGAWTWVRRILGVQLLLIAAAGGVAFATGAQAGTALGITTAMLAVAAMAAQNALLHLTFRKTPTTAVMTGNIVAGTVALVGLVLRGRKDDRDSATWREAWPLITGFFGGCFFGALTCGLVGDAAWAVPTVLSGVVLLCSLLTDAPPEMTAMPLPVAEHPQMKENSTG